MVTRPTANRGPFKQSALAPGANSGGLSTIKLTHSLEGVASTSVISPGIYPAEVVKVEEKFAQSGNQMLVFEFRVTEGDFANRHVWANRTLTPNSLSFLVELLEALGVTGIGGELDPNGIVGKRCYVVVTNEEYNGRLQNRVDQVLPESYVPGE